MQAPSRAPPGTSTLALRAVARSELDLAYAPPFGSAKDPVNYAGFVAANVLRGDANLCHVEDCNAPTEGQALLDVRTPEDVEAGTLPGAMAIPLDDLRERYPNLRDALEKLRLNDSAFTFEPESSAGDWRWWTDRAGGVSIWG